MNPIRWLRERRRQQEVEAKATEQMRRDEETGTSPEPKEVKLSQLRD
jgi:hypothetical protein